MQTHLNEVFLLQILSRQRRLRPLPRDWDPDEVNKSRDSKGSRETLSQQWRYIRERAKHPSSGLRLAGRRSREPSDWPRAESYCKRPRTTTISEPKWDHTHCSDSNNRIGNLPLARRQSLRLNVTKNGIFFPLFLADDVFRWTGLNLRNMKLI